MFAYTYRFFATRPRLIIAILVGSIAYWGLPYLAHVLDFLPIAGAYSELKPISHFLLAWNIGVITYLITVYMMMYHADSAHILNKAIEEDEGTILMLLLALAASVVSIMAIIQELAVSKDAQGLWMAFHLGLTFLTIVSSWLVIHTLFALHYASLYYRVENKYHRQILDFPTDINPTDTDKTDSDTTDHGTTDVDPTEQTDKQQLQNEEKPNHWDFLYFAFIIGTSGQTADVAFNTRQARQLGTLHCVLAFFFNVSILALMINIASGLIN